MGKRRTHEQRVQLTPQVLTMNGTKRRFKAFGYGFEPVDKSIDAGNDRRRQLVQSVMFQGYPLA